MFYAYSLSYAFQRLANEQAELPALRFSDRVVTYGQLDSLANSLASLLLAKGCKRGDVIAIGHDKKLLSYALMLAALRIGVPYVNFDTASPVERLNRIMDTCCARLVFYDDPSKENLIRELTGSGMREGMLLSENELYSPSQLELESVSRAAAAVDGACIAYIMFTSGSTGIPKGVAVTHQNAIHFIAWGKRCFEVNKTDVFAQLSPMYFDNSVFDFYVGLFSGASLAPVPRELMTKPYELVPFVGKSGATIWFSVPSLLMYMMTMKAMKAAALPAIRAFSFGGEGYPKAELKKLFDMFAGKARLFNVYGPTECTCICSAHVISDADFADMSGLPTLGFLNENFDYRIVDEEGRDSRTGELWLIGPNVASGYFNDPERTEAAFSVMTNPNRYMKRVYKTGDIVNESDNGHLNFIGRKDNQIKHMGYRIELEEIEQAMARVPGVDQAAAVYRRISGTHGKIYGFAACSLPIDERVILDELSKTLPDYMIPGKITLLSELPKNANGKVDRKHLAALLG